MMYAKDDGVGGYNSGMNAGYSQGGYGGNNGYGHHISYGGGHGNG